MFGHCWGAGKGAFAFISPGGDTDASSARRGAGVLDDYAESRMNSIRPVAALPANSACPNVTSGAVDLP